MTQSILKAQLAVLIRKGNPAELRDYLSTLRNADFRLAGTVLAEPDIWVGADFWQFAATLVAANNRAFLGTMLKAASALELTMPSSAFVGACTTDVDRRKSLESLLPRVASPAEIHDLLRLFAAPSQPQSDVPHAINEAVLFSAGTAPAYFVLFNLLKQHEDDTAYLRRFGIELIRKGDKRSFNLACIIKEYFALPELPGTFSLALQPYELSRLETSFDTFLTIINR